MKHEYGDVQKTFKFYRNKVKFILKPRNKEKFEEQFDCVYQRKIPRNFTSYPAAIIIKKNKIPNIEIKR